MVRLSKQSREFPKLPEPYKKISPAYLQKRRAAAEIEAGLLAPDGSPSQAAAEIERIWINRSVTGLSYSELDLATRKFNPAEARRKVAYYSLSVIVSNEVFAAINASGRSNTNPSIIADRLVDGFPESVNRSVVAEVEGLKQYGSWIGIHADYDSFEEERKFISQYLSDALGIEHRWKQEPHISLARGVLSTLSNRDQIEALLPQFIQLGTVNRHNNLTDIIN